MDFQAFVTLLKESSLKTIKKFCLGAELPLDHQTLGIGPGPSGSEDESMVGELAVLTWSVCCHS